MTLEKAKLWRTGDWSKLPFAVFLLSHIPSSGFLKPNPFLYQHENTQVIQVSIRA